MSTHSRLGWLLLGCVIGFVFGYIVRSLREIKDGVEEVDKHVIEHIQDHDEGIATGDLLSRIALFLVVLLVAWSSFLSQKSSNDVKDTQQSQKLVTSCSQEFLAKTITALNERTTYTQEATAANVKLQTAFSKLVTLSLRQPPPGPEEGRRIVEDYATSLKEFLTFSKKSSDKVQQNPYPTSQELRSCLKGK